MSINIRIKLKTGFQYELRDLQRLVVQENRLIMIEAYSKAALTEDKWDSHTYDTLFLKDIDSISLKLID